MRDVLDVIVVGGGVAGLSAAWRLQRAGLGVRVLEAADGPGGNVRTVTIDGFRLELGPHTLLASGDWVFDLAEEAGLDDDLCTTRPESSDRFVARDGRLHAMPTGAWSFLTTPLLSLGSKLTLATEPFRWQRGQPGDTAQEFFERRFGPEAARVLAGAFISGVYAGDPAQLSAPAAFPLFWGFERDHGSMILGAVAYFRRRAAERRAAGVPRRTGLFSFRGGLGRLPEALAAGLGDAFVAGSPVEAVERADGLWRVRAGARVEEARALLLAVPPHDAARLLAGVAPALGAALEGIPMAPVAVVHLGYRQRQPAVPEGFGFLVPRGESIRSLGVLFPSRLFEDRAPAGGDLLVGFVGGTKDPDALALGDAALESIVRGDLERLLGLRAAPDLVRVVRFERAIPQLVVGHPERMAEVRDHLAALPGLLLAGNWLSGVGLKDAVRSGLETATAAEAWLRPPELRGTPGVEARG